jgi:hypothetical protein
VTPPPGSCQENPSDNARILSKGISDNPFLTPPEAFVKGYQLISAGEPARRYGFCVSPQVVYLPCEVCPVLAVVGVVGALVAGALELDIDEDDALVVGAVDAGADGGLRAPD